MADGAGEPPFIATTIARCKRATNTAGLWQLAIDWAGSSGKKDADLLLIPLLAAFETWRQTRTELSRKNQAKASKSVPDLSAFRLLTNFVRSKPHRRVLNGLADGSEIDGPEGMPGGVSVRKNRPLPPSEGAEDPMKIATLLFTLFAFAPACASQQPAKTPTKEPFVVEAGEVLLTNLIDKCAAYLDCNILLSPQEMAVGGQGSPQVRLQKAISTDRAGCEEFLANMLYRSGLALTYANEKGTIIEVINMAGARGREVTNRAIQRSVDEVLARPDLKLPVLTMLTLKHINATIATNALRPFFASTGSPQGGGSLSLGNVGNSSALLLQGMQDQVAQAIRLVRACDVPPSPEQMEQRANSNERIEMLERRIKALEDKLAESVKPK